MELKWTSKALSDLARIGSDTSTFAPRLARFDRLQIRPEGGQPLRIEQPVFCRVGRHEKFRLATFRGNHRSHALPAGVVRQRRVRPRAAFGIGLDQKRIFDSPCPPLMHGAQPQPGADVYKASDGMQLAQLLRKAQEVLGCCLAYADRHIPLWPRFSGNAQFQ